MGLLSRGTDTGLTYCISPNYHMKNPKGGSVFIGINCYECPIKVSGSSESSWAPVGVAADAFVLTSRGVRRLPEASRGRGQKCAAVRAYIASAASCATAAERNRSAAEVGRGAMHIHGGTKWDIWQTMMKLRCRSVLHSSRLLEYFPMQLYRSF